MEYLPLRFRMCNFSNNCSIFENILSIIFPCSRTCLDTARRRMFTRSEWLSASSQMVFRPSRIWKSFKCYMRSSEVCERKENCAYFRIRSRDVRKSWKFFWVLFLEKKKGFKNLSTRNKNWILSLKLSKLLVWKTISRLMLFLVGEPLVHLLQVFAFLKP